MTCVAATRSLTRCRPDQMYVDLDTSFIGFDSDDPFSEFSAILKPRGIEMTLLLDWAELSVSERGEYRGAVVQYVGPIVAIEAMLVEFFDGGNEYTE